MTPEEKALEREAKDKARLMPNTTLLDAFAAQTKALSIYTDETLRAKAELHAYAYRYELLWRLDVYR